MATLRDFSPEETARLGDEIYSRVVHPALKSEDQGKAIAIDVRSEAWGIGDTGISASRMLRETHPDAEVWIVRVGGGPTIVWEALHGGTPHDLWTSFGQSRASELCNHPG